MKKSRLLCAAMAAVMTVGIANVPVSAELSAAPEAQDTAIVDVDDKKDYDEADWEAYKRKYWLGCNCDEDDDGEYDEDEIDIKITNDGIIYGVYSNVPEVYLVDYIGKGEDLVIPKEINGFTVSVLDCFDDDMRILNFDNIENIKTLTIKAELSDLYSSFNNCPKLEKVVLPDGLTSIGGFPYNDAPYSKENSVFSNCPKLKEVYIPDSVEYVRGYSFFNTPWLEAREKSEGLVIIGKSLLSGRQAKGKVVIPNTVTTICSKAFFDNDKMTELVVPGTIGTDYYSWEEYGHIAKVFYNCTALNKITFKNGCGYMFDFLTEEDAPNLKKVILPPSFIQGAAEYAFDQYDKPTYYYYKGTPTEKALKLKKYSHVKKSVLPAKTKKFKAAGKKRAVKTVWKPVSSATGYQIQLSTVKTFKKNVTKKYIKNRKKTTYTFKNLVRGRKYYVRMRSYKTIDGKKYYGNFTKVKAVRAK
ncbi:MAG: leucine-rich repeat protein [Ruminococcus sp.]|nr:leucine-rich repeat protein [Ruminococcus sp.]